MEDQSTKKGEAWGEGARELGREHARNAASWVADGNSPEAGIRQVLAMLEEGDPEAEAYLPTRPDLSGEYADELNPRKLFEEITGLDAHAEASWNADAYNTVVDGLCDAYEDGVSEVFEDACVTELRKWLGEGEN